jgi:transposase
MGTAIGIDIHQHELSVAVHQGPRWTEVRTDAGLRRLTTRLVALGPAVVVVEPSGGYERTVIAALQAAGLPVARVHPGRVRTWIREALGVKTKTDALDARHLAQYGATVALRVLDVPSAAQRELDSLIRVRRILRDDLVATRHQRAEQPAVAAAILDRTIAFLQTELRAVTRQIDALVAATPDWARRRVILGSCPGVGDRSVALVLGALPELGQRSAKELAALVGLAPFTQQSGQRQPTAAISGGRAEVRADLWVPTLTAMRTNPTIQAFAERLRAKGKPHKVIVIACMHKLLTILNAMVRADTVWNADHAAA